MNEDKKVIYLFAKPRKVIDRTQSEIMQIRRQKRKELIEKLRTNIPKAPPKD
jgi:hypothetical protein